MKKIGHQRGHIYRGNDAPPPDGQLLRALNQQEFTGLTPTLQRIIREQIGDALAMQTAIESFLRELPPQEKSQARLAIFRVFGATELSHGPA